MIFFLIDDKRIILSKARKENKEIVKTIITQSEYCNYRLIIEFAFSFSSEISYLRAFNTITFLPLCNLRLYPIVPKTDGNKLLRAIRRAAEKHTILDADSPGHLYSRVISRFFGWSEDDPVNIKYL